MLNVVKNIIAGLLIGLSNVVPGVSGGTIACVFGVYENMLALPSFDIKKLKKEYSSILSLYLGIAIGILLFSKVISYVYERFPIYIHFFFVGVICASLSFLYDKTLEKKISGQLQNRFNMMIKTVLFVLAFLLMFSMYILKKRGVMLDFNYTPASFSFYARLMIYSAIACAGMMVPGISGSFLLLILGAYKIVIDAVAHFNYKLLFVVGIGIAVGAILSAKLIKFLIVRFRTFSYAFILGLTVGSIIHVFPVVCQPFYQRFISALFLFVGYVLVTLFLRIDSINGGE